MSVLVRLLLAVLACYRLARLLSVDDGPGNVFLRLRALVPPDRMWGKLLLCPYCLGVWLAVLAPLVVLAPTTVSDVLLVWLGVAGAQDFLESRS